MAIEQIILEAKYFDIVFNSKERSLLIVFKWTFIPAGDSSKEA